MDSKTSLTWVNLSEQKSRVAVRILGLPNASQLWPNAKQRHQEMAGLRKSLFKSPEGEDSSREKKNSS